MKTLTSIFIILTALIFSSCDSGSPTTGKQQVLDSVNGVAMTNRIEQLRTDSIKNASVSQTHHNGSSTQPYTEAGTGANSTSQANTTEPHKKGMSNTTKGALIGAGAGAATGAVAGAVISKDNKGQGAIVGGLIGGAVGSGVGYAAGHKIDKKKK